MDDFFVFPFEEHNKDIEVICFRSFIIKCIRNMELVPTLIDSLFDFNQASEQEIQQKVLSEFRRLENERESINDFFEDDEHNKLLVELNSELQKKIHDDTVIFNERYQSGDNAQVAAKGLKFRLFVGLFGEQDHTAPTPTVNESKLHVLPQAIHSTGGGGGGGGGKKKISKRRRRRRKLTRRRRRKLTKKRKRKLSKRRKIRYRGGPGNNVHSGHVGGAKARRRPVLDETFLNGFLKGLWITFQDSGPRGKKLRQSGLKGQNGFESREKTERVRGEISIVGKKTTRRSIYKITLFNPHTRLYVVLILKITNNSEFLSKIDIERDNYRYLNHNEEKNPSEVLRCYNTGDSPQDNIAPVTHGLYKQYTFKEYTFKTSYSTIYPPNISNISNSFKPRIKFSLALQLQETDNRYLLLEFSENYKELFDFLYLSGMNDYYKKKAFIMVVESINRLNKSYNFVHADLKSDNVLIVVNEAGHPVGVKQFDFDRSFYLDVNLITEREQTINQLKGQYDYYINMFIRDTTGTLLSEFYKYSNVNYHAIREKFIKDFNPVSNTWETLLKEEKWIEKRNGEYVYVNQSLVNIKETLLLLDLWRLLLSLVVWSVRFEEGSLYNLWLSEIELEDYGPDYRSINYIKHILRYYSINEVLYNIKTELDWAFLMCLPIIIKLQEYIYRPVDGQSPQPLPMPRRVPGITEEQRRMELKEWEDKENDRARLMERWQEEQGAAE